MPVKKFFHTQEKRDIRLSQPIKCIRKDAWLGEGYYFWEQETDAMKWGVASKKNTGKYEIYIGIIDFENILDTVFNEEHYYFWKETIEKVAKAFIKKTNEKPSIKYLNEFLKEKCAWSAVDGILFQDLPNSPDYNLVDKLYYTKRIQLVIFSLNRLKSFEYYMEGRC